MNNSMTALAQLFASSIENNLIAEDENYKLFRPQNSWEMNYQLKRKGYKIIYLIDVDDFSEIDNIKDFNDVIKHSWKAIEE